MEFPNNINDEIFKQVASQYISQLEIIDRYNNYLDNILSFKERILIFECLFKELQEFNNMEKRMYFSEFKNIISVWVGLLYLENMDIILEIEKIMLSLGNHMTLKKIIQFIQNYPCSFVNYVLLGLSAEDSSIIRWYRSQFVIQNIVNKFREKYYLIKRICEKISFFYIEQKKILDFKKVITSIKILRNRFPIEIVEKIIYMNKLPLDICIFNFYLNNQTDIKLITNNLNANIICLKKVVYFYLKNNKDITSTITDICDNN